MSEPKRLHPITVAFELLKTIKEAIIPLVLYGIVFMKNRDADVWSFLPVLIFTVFVIAIIITAIIRWSRYTYRIEEMELRIEHGLFVKKKRYIPIDRITSLDFSESILHRPFGLVKVKVETAGTDQAAEAELTAIKMENATALREIIAAAKSKQKSESEIIEETHTGTILYKITHPQLLFFATTSGRAWVIVSAILAFAGQFEDIIPFEKIFKEMEQLVRVGYLLVTFFVLIGLIISWLFSVVMAYLKYNDFTVRKMDDELIITRGLLEKRTTTIPINRIQAVKIKESPVRQPFGYTSVSLETAGGSVMDKEQTENLLLPVVKKEKIIDILSSSLEDYDFNVSLAPVPKKALRRYMLINVLFVSIFTVGLSYFLWPYGLFSILFIVCAGVLGLFQFRSAAWNVSGQQLVLRYRGVMQYTVFMRKNRIQSLDIKTNWFQKRAKLATVQAVVMNGGAGHTSQVAHLNKREAESIYEWYRPGEIHEPRGNE